MATNGLGFKDWAIKEAVYWNDDIEELRGKKIGIDAEHYLASFLASRKEPLLPALGGLPFSLKARVDEELARFEDAGIAPLFVFNGLDLACNDRATILRSSAKAADALDAAWRIYDAGRADDAVAAFGFACTYRTGHIIRALQAHLHTRGVEVWVAPYSALAQLVELERCGSIVGSLGSASMLVHESEMGVILDFDWEARQFKHTDTEKCAADVNVSESLFIDLCLLCGYSLLPILPELDVESLQPKLLTAKSLLQRTNNDVYAVCGRSSNEEYKMLYHKAKYAVRNATVFHLKTLEVGQIRQELAPADTHDFVSQRLPNELYWYLIRGLVGPRILNWRTRMEVLELPPLDGGLSQTYKDLVSSKLLPLRSQSLVMITHLLHRYYQKHDVDLACWFSEDAKKALNIPDSLQSAKQASYWNVTSKQLRSMNGMESSPLRYAIESLSSGAIGKDSKKYHEEHTMWNLDQISELRPNIIWRFLEHRGYIKADHTLSAWGKALDIALRQASESDSVATPTVAREIEEAIFMAFELVRLDCLNARNMFPVPPYSGPPMRGSEIDKQNTLLISRIACLATLQHKAIGYTGPLSRHLLAYHQVIASVRGALRDLVEVHAANLFLSGATKRKIGPPTMFNDLAVALPFGDEPDAGLGLLIKSYLDELSNDSPRQPPKASVKEWFVHAVDLEGDMSKAWKLFEVVNAGLQAAENGIVSAETKKMFQGASDWLAEKLKADSGEIS